VLPKFDRHDLAVVARMLVIPFLVQHERGAVDTKRPENIMESLTPEYPAILRVFAEYYVKLKKDHNGIIPISKECESYKTEVINENESDLDKFIGTCIVFEKNRREKKDRVYQEYLKYLEVEEDKKGTLSRKTFSTLILKNYKEYVTDSIQRIDGGNPSRIFIGMRVKTFEEIAEEEEARMKSANAPVQVERNPTAAADAPPADEDPFR